MRLFQNIDAMGPVTRINGSFADYCVFVMQSRIKRIYKLDKLDKIDALIYRKKNVAESISPSR